MAANFNDKIYLAVSLLGLGGGAWVSMQKDPTMKPTGAPPLVKHIPVAKDAPQVPTEEWQEPSAQKDGPKWIYEVFTSPRIYYADGQFIVDPPVPKVIPPPPPFGVEFVQVKPDPFRLQLTGYVGQDGIFLDVKNDDTIYGHAGLALPDLDLVVENFQVKDAPLEDMEPGDTPVMVPTGIAVVRDTKTGEKTTLTSQKRLMSGLPFALLKTSDGTLLAPMKAGDKFTVDGAGAGSFTIESVTENPPVITVTKAAQPPDLPEADTRPLTPQAPAKSGSSRISLP